MWLTGTGSSMLCKMRGDQGILTHSSVLDITITALSSEWTVLLGSLD